MKYRLATPKDVPALLVLAVLAKQPETGPADVVFLGEECGLPVVAIGLDLSHETFVVLSGGIVHPAFYRDAAAVGGLRDFFEQWLIEHNCFAYVFSVTKRNRRMQKWMERAGAHRYAKIDNRLWYIRTLGEHKQGEPNEQPETHQHA